MNLLSMAHDDAPDRYLDLPMRAVWYRHCCRHAVRAVRRGAIVWALGIDELVPKAVIFFSVLAIIGLVGHRFWPKDWFGNPLL